MMCGLFAMSFFQLLSVSAAPAPSPEGNAGGVLLSGISYDCGSEATYCPPSFEGSRSEYISGKLLFVDQVGEKPIPTRPGYRFVDWEIKSIGANIQPYNGNALKAGDRLANWNSYLLENLFELEEPFGKELFLTAVWVPNTDSQTIPINLSVAATPINVTLPSSIELVFNGTDVNALAPSNLSVINNGSVGNVKVSSVKGTLKDATWKLNKNSSSTVFEALPLDSKEIYVGFGKDASSVQTITEEGIDPQIKLGPSSTTTKSQSFIIQSKTGGSSKAIDSEIINIEFTLAFEREPVEISIDSASVQAMGVKSPWYSNKDNTTFGWEAPELGEIMPLKYVSSTKGFTSSIDITFTLPSPGTITYYINEPDLTYFHESNVYFEWITEGFDGFSAGYNEIKLDAGTYTIYGGVYSTTIQPTTFPESLVETIYIEDIKIVLD